MPITYTKHVVVWEWDVRNIYFADANRAQEKEIDELKSKIAQVLAVMPNDTIGISSSNNISRVRLAESPPSNLDPNATAYTPKSSLVASTEA